MPDFTFHFETVVVLKAKTDIEAEDLDHAIKILGQQLSENGSEFFEELEFEDQGPEGRILHPYLYGIKQDDEDWTIFNPLNTLLQEYVNRHSEKGI